MNTKLLKIINDVEGFGSIVVKNNDMVKVRYTARSTNGVLYDCSGKAGVEAIEVPTNKLPEALSYIIPGMKAGGYRTAEIPVEDIMLIYDIEVISIN